MFNKYNPILLFTRVSRACSYYFAHMIVSPKVGKGLTKLDTHRHSCAMNGSLLCQHLILHLIFASIIQKTRGFRLNSCMSYNIMRPPRLPIIHMTLNFRAY